MSRKKKSRTTDKWQGYTYEQKKAIQDRISVLHGLLRTLYNNVSKADIDTDTTYNNIFEQVEALYGELDIHNLTLDNQRRWQEHKDELRRKGLTEL
jgi:hypothetical protein